MSERLVDVLDVHGNVIHTFPISLGASGEPASDDDYLTKALEAAGHAQLVPDDELAGLTARLHVDRSGQMAPYGDDGDPSSQTNASLEQAVRERAYKLWEDDGRPEGRSEDYWHLAVDQHLRERAYVMWEQKGGGKGDADKDWTQTEKFEEQ